MERELEPPCGNILKLHQTSAVKKTTHKHTHTYGENMLTASEHYVNSNPICLYETSS